jgi:hypothetical protein
MRQRPRSRAIAVARQGTTQGVHRAAMLEKQGSGHSGITGVYINSRSVSRRIQEYLSRSTSFESADTHGVANAYVLEVE